MESAAPAIKIISRKGKAQMEARIPGTERASKLHPSFLAMLVPFCPVFNPQISAIIEDVEIHLIILLDWNSFSGLYV
jgi:hypothetical protein